MLKTVEFPSTKSSGSIHSKSAAVFHFGLVFLITISIVLMSAVVHGAQVKVTIAPNTSSDVAGHKIYYCLSQDFSKTNYSKKIDILNDTAYVVSDLQEGSTYYFAATAYDKNGNESVFSEVYSYKVPHKDSDGDGTPDIYDKCPNDPFKVDPGLCGCGIPDTDSDGDGTPDCFDQCPKDPFKINPGLCGCGVPDTDTDGDGTPDCFDQCPTDPFKVEPGLNGCGVPDTDFNDDGTPNMENNDLTEDFETYDAGSDPSDWFDTRANNSMVEDDSLFKVFAINNNRVFGTTSTLMNIHSHHLKSYIENLTSFEYSGRMMMTDPGSGIGVTFLSHYPFTDAYYRLRWDKWSSSFHLAPHPHATATVFGTIETGVTPKANQWYRFRIKVQDTGTQTEILAKVWPENDSEPDQWQIDAYDDSPDRLVSGAIGVWSGGAGNKYWDDLSVQILTISDNGSKPVFPGENWQIASPESQGVDPVILTSALNYFNSNSSGTGSDEMVIVRNGYIIWKGVSSEAFHSLYSGTKPFTTTVMGLLIQQGVISSVHDPAINYLPSLDDKYSTYAGITFKHLATFTSGYNADTKAVPDMQWGDPRKFLTPLSPLASPGTKFQYFDPAIHQLGNILTVASGDTLENIFKTGIADVIGMKNWQWRHHGYYDNGTSTKIVADFLNPSGIYGGGIHITPLDVARFGLLYLNRGNWNGRQVLSSDFVDVATTNQVPITLQTASFDRRGNFGYMWYTNDIGANGTRLWPSAPPKTYTFQGSGRNYCFVIPEWEMVIARMSPADQGAINDQIWDGFFSRLKAGITESPLP